ncbi:MAG TPA: hypothetical protein PLD54_00465 [Candidatus Levybacteria bacterium]|nr:hypothetical protein [Candidatus Levybacteria bacterium]
MSESDFSPENVVNSTSEGESIVATPTEASQKFLHKKDSVMVSMANWYSNALLIAAGGMALYDTYGRGNVNDKTIKQTLAAGAAIKVFEYTMRSAPARAAGRALDAFFGHDEIQASESKRDVDRTDNQ